MIFYKATLFCIKYYQLLNTFNGCLIIDFWPTNFFWWNFNLVNLGNCYKLVENLVCNLWIIFFFIDCRHILRTSTVSNIGNCLLTTSFHTTIMLSFNLDNNLFMVPTCYLKVILENSTRVFIMNVYFQTRLEIWQHQQN